MAEAAKHPFEGYTLYIVYHKKEDRTMAQLVKSSTDRTTMSYARYLMCVHLGRILAKDEHVDHINDDKNDDRIENFQILTQEQNREKYAKANPRKMYELICPICQCMFYRDIHRLWQKVNPCCSRKCGGLKASRTCKENKLVEQQVQNLGVWRKLVDASDLKSDVRKGVPVRLRVLLPDIVVNPVGSEL